MIKGIDTTFLIQLEDAAHPYHSKSRNLFTDLLDRDTRFAVTPQTLAEFVHVITDQRRFENPLDITQALHRADVWWNSEETVQVFPSSESTELFLKWMSNHRLGRKRLLDTQWAATMHAAGINDLVTSNVRDFQIFGCFKITSP